MSVVVPDRDAIEKLRASHEQLMKLGLSLEDSCLQNVIVDADGKILVGKHRKYAVQDWPEKKINTNNDPLLRELIILHGNVQRVVTEEETRMRFLRVARLLEQRGIKKEDASAEMAKIVPYTDRYIRQLLPKEYKNQTKVRAQICGTGSANLDGEDTETTKFLEAIDERREKYRKMLEEVVKKAFSITDEPEYPFPDCRCKGCPKENVCPRVML